MNTTILLIDDDKNITNLLSRCLNEFGFEVIAANKGCEAAALLRKHDTAIVILDLMMPEMDGWQVCREIRNFSRVPIIIYSAMSDPRTMASILDTGADYFLVKPAPVNTLVSYIRNAISCPEQHQKNNTSKSLNNPSYAMLS